jgi:glucose-6-phosphate 1-dehydrogenase
LSTLAPDVEIVGTSLEDYDDESFRTFARSAVDEFGTQRLSDDQWAGFAGKLHYVRQSAGPEALAQAVAVAEQRLGDDVRRLHYLSVPPKAALAVIEMLRSADLVDRSRVVMEKPFGSDLDSAVRLNDQLHETFTEPQIFRIDHFLGKEPAQNILAFRFANGLFEPIWNRNFIDHVQIDIPETLGLDRRVEFYESTGAYKDMVVTHLLQVLAFVAIEPPTALEPRAISEEKNKVFRSLLPIDPAHVVRGQYDGYRSEEGVAPHSETETFIALKCGLDNWRWADVPIYVRVGKRLPKSGTEISVHFKKAPSVLFNKESQAFDQNVLVIRIQPDEGISLRMQAKMPGTSFRIEPVKMDFHYGTSFGKASPEAYERLLLNAMSGDATLFARRDEVEQAWAFIDTIEHAWAAKENAPGLFTHPAGSWGPDEADELLARDGRAWRRL